ncbi:Spherulin [Oopsacas minuta]|uniref:Spherulin n=1 Tax=Oopsacas minuta TaxID=111878 RepID=A0AAV7JBT0_9METZ|nr:Spherulin [Oopsacas minuta]
MANKSDILKVGLFPFANIEDTYDSYIQMISREFKKVSPNTDLDLVIGDKFNPYAPDLSEYLGADGFDILEFDMARKDDFHTKVLEVAIEPFRYLTPAVEAVKVEGGAHIGYPTLCCGNFIMEVKRSGELAIDMGDKDYDEFKNSAYVAEKYMVEPNKSHYTRLLGGKLDDSDGWYLPFIYLDAFIDVHGRQSLQQGIDDVLQGKPDPIVVQRLTEFSSLFPKKQLSTDQTIQAIVNGKIAYFYGFSEILGKILDASNGSLKAFGALTPTLGKEKLVLVFTDAIVINKVRFEQASEEKKKVIGQFAQFFTSARIREAVVMGQDLNPPQIRYLLPSTVEFYQGTNNLVYTELYEMVREGVSSPSMTEKKRQDMEDVLTKCFTKKEKRERYHFSKGIPIDIDASCSLNDILEELDVEESTTADEVIDERTLRHEVRGLKFWNLDGNSLKFTSKLSNLVPHQCETQELQEQFASSESSESANLTNFS